MSKINCKNLKTAASLAIILGPAALITSMGMYRLVKDPEKYAKSVDALNNPPRPFR